MGEKAHRVYSLSDVLKYLIEKRLIGHVAVSCLQTDMANGYGYVAICLPLIAADTGQHELRFQDRSPTLRCRMF